MFNFQVEYMSFLIFFILVFVFSGASWRGQSRVSVVGGVCKPHISIGWHRIEGAGPFPEKQTSSACASARQQPQQRGPSGSPSFSATGSLSASCAYLRSLTRRSLFDQHSVKVAPFPRKRGEMDLVCLVCVTLSIGAWFASAERHSVYWNSSNPR